MNHRLGGRCVARPLPEWSSTNAGTGLQAALTKPAAKLRRLGKIIRVNGCDVGEHGEELTPTEREALGRPGGKPGKRLAQPIRKPNLAGI
ncbi:MAG: hypothetical protein WCT12_15420 [Verrucomicrobiota bacterium]